MFSLSFSKGVEFFISNNLSLAFSRKLYSLQLQLQVLHRSSTKFLFIKFR